MLLSGYSYGFNVFFLVSLVGNSGATKLRFRRSRNLLFKLSGDIPEVLNTQMVDVRFEFVVDRLELSKRLPCLGINEKSPVQDDTQSTTTTA